MTTYTINIVGVIGEQYLFTDLLQDLNNAKEFDSIHLAINSVGGYVNEAEKMIEAINNTGKFITSSNTGDVASAASKIFTIPTIENRTFYQNRGVFLIHNPWGAVEGDSAELKEYSDELKKIEDSYAKWYSSQTGTDVSIIKSLMSENVPLSPEQVESFGFAKLGYIEVLAVAKLQTNINNKQMTEEQTKEFAEKVGLIDGLLDKAKALFKKDEPKAIMLSDVEGNELDFPGVQAPEEITVGVEVLLAGEPANGSFTQPDGTIYVVEGGKLIEITEPEAEVEEDAEALKQKVTELEAQLEAEATAKAEAEAKVEELNTEIQAKAEAFSEVVKEFEGFKAQASDYKVETASPESKDVIKEVSKKVTFNLKKK